MNNKIKKVLVALCGSGIIILVVLAFVSIFALLFGSILQIFGFKYESVGSFILFFTLVMIVGLPIEIFTAALPKALLYLERINIMAAKILFVIIDAFATIITMTVIDYFMDSVSVSDLAVVIVSFIFALLSVNEIDKPISKKIKEN